MKISYHIKHITSILSIVGFVVLLVLSPCKVRNSIQDVFEIPKTAVTNKSISTLVQSVCNSFAEAETVITKSTFNPESSPVIVLKHSVFNTAYVALSNRPVSRYNKSRDAIPPLVPYYILFQNNKAYL